MLIQLEGEVGRKAVQIPFQSLIESLGRDLVEIGQVAIEYDLLPPDKIDASLDEFGRNG